MTLRKWLVTQICIAMIALCFVGCTQQAAPAQPAGPAAAAEAPAAGSSEETVKFALIAPLNGSNAEFGKTYQTAVTMAVEEINANGGVNGRKLVFEVFDSKGDAATSADMCRKISDDPSMIAILGDYSSSCCMANAPIVEEAGIMMCSGGASNPAYCVMNDYCFSINGREDVEAPYFCQYLIGKYLECKDLAILWVNTDYGQGSVEIFTAEAAKAGINVVASESYIDGEADFSAVINKLRAAKPDTLLILDTSSCVSTILNQVAQAGWDVKIANLGAGTSTQIIDLAGANANGLLTTGPFYYDKNNQVLVDWFTEFESRAGYECEFQGPVMRDATYMLAAAIEACGDDITRQNVRDNFAALDFEGFTGEIKFEEDGSVARAYYIFQVDGSEWVEKAGLNYPNE
ncbi:MAG: ABC transporter substrate-binding protein [Candidatus Pelethousia sp.]|nr:ABC transporter substrate-binding protein [Candidatus Pelethousia sp.]